MFINTTAYTICVQQSRSTESCVRVLLAYGELTAACALLSRHLDKYCSVHAHKADAAAPADMPLALVDYAARLSAVDDNDAVRQASAEPVN